MLYRGPEMEIVEFDEKVLTNGFTVSEDKLGADDGDPMNSGSKLGN